MWATIIIAESFTRIMGWTAQLVMCTVLSSDRRCRFLQYNFMDPGWGARISYGGPGPLPPQLAPALLCPPVFECRPSYDVVQIKVCISALHTINPVV